jgi:hypothetical protein
MANNRFVGFGICFAVLLAGCSGGGISLTEYVDQLNAIELQASQQGDTLANQAEQTDDFTPKDLQAILEGARVIRIDVKEATDGIDPPKQVADVHNLVFDWHTRFIFIEEALASRAGIAADTAFDWEKLSNSPEMEAYRAAIAEGKQACTDLQAKLDATEERGAFADVPWIPNEMQEVVERLLGCVWFPEHPENVYRYPPPSNTP